MTAPLSNVHTDDAARRAGAVILAAGAGSRMGRPKALLEFEGQLLVERTVETALAGGCARAIVVLGAQADEVRRRAALGSAEVVVNEDWGEGMGSSLRAGLAALDAAHEMTRAQTPDPHQGQTPRPIYDAALVLLVDQPFVGPEAVRAVLSAWQAGARLASASYAGRRGHPVLFGREHWPAVARSAVGDAGARAFLAEHADDIVLVACDGLATPRDLDTPADLAAVRATGSG
jgi:nicotine blue oxidoreductase